MSGRLGNLHRPGLLSPTALPPPCPCRVHQRLRRPGVHIQGTCSGLPRPPHVSTRCWQSVEFTWEFPRRRSWGVHSVEPTSVLPRIRMLGMPCVQSRREGVSALAPSCAVRGGSWAGVRGREYDSSPLEPRVATAWAHRS